MCTWPDCDRTDLKALGFCVKHYARVRRGATPKAPVSRIFCRTVDDVRSRCTTSPDGCWLWQGAVDRHGYGRIGTGGIQTSTHRWVYVRTVGPVPDGLDLDHLCRVRLCCNPAHLEPVTRSENLRRGAEARGPLQQCKRGHDLTDPANLYTGTADGRPRCRPCRLQRQRNYDRTRRANVQETTT